MNEQAGDEPMATDPVFQDDNIVDAEFETLDDADDPGRTGA